MSNLSAIEYIANPSAGTTGLWNQRFSVISANFAALNSDLTLSSPSGNTFSVLSGLEVIGGGHFQYLSVGSTPPSYATTAAITVEVNSASSDYLYMVDSSGQKSSYVLGSRAGNIADGLALWDASASTMIVSFSKQSVRFYQQVVAPIFDSGGAVFNVATYGTKGDGVTDDAAAILAAASACTNAGGGTLFFPEGQYVIGSTITILQNTSTTTGIFRMQGSGRGATTFLPQVAPAFSIGAAALPGNIIGFSADNFTFRLNKDLYWHHGIMRLGRIIEFDLANIELLGGPSYNSPNVYSGYLFEFDTAYEGFIRSCVHRGRYTYFSELNSVVNPDEQQDSLQFLRCQGLGVSLHAIVRSSTGDWNNVTWQGNKIIANTGADVSADDNTTLTASHATGVSTLSVAAVSSFDTNDPILIGSGNTAEFNKVTGINAGTNTLSLLTGTRFLQTSGTSILHGPVGLSLSGNNIGFAIRDAHWEFLDVGVLADSVRMLQLENVFSTVRDVVRVTGGPVRDIVMLQQSPFGTSGVSNLVHVLGSGATVGSTRFCFYGPYYGTQGTAYTPYTSDDTTTQQLVRIINRSDAGPNQNWDEALYPVGSTHTYMSTFVGTPSAGTYTYKQTVDGILSYNTFGPVSGATVSLNSGEFRVVGVGRTDGVLIRNNQPGVGANYEVRNLGSGVFTLSNNSGDIQLQAGTNTGNEIQFNTGSTPTGRFFIRSGGSMHCSQPVNITAGSAVAPGLGCTSELSLGIYRSGTSTFALSYGTFMAPALWATSGLSVGNSTAGGTLIPAISSISSLVAAFVVQGSASSFTVITWAAAQPGDQILTTVQPDAAVSSISSGLVAHSHCTKAGQIEFRLSNASTLAQNQSSKTWYFTRITPF